MRNTGPLSQEFMFLMSVAKKLLLKNRPRVCSPGNTAVQINPHAKVLCSQIIYSVGAIFGSSIFLLMMQTEMKETLELAAVFRECSPISVLSEEDILRLSPLNKLIQPDTKLLICARQHIPPTTSKYVDKCMWHLYEAQCIKQQNIKNLAKHRTGSENAGGNPQEVGVFVERPSVVIFLQAEACLKCLLKALLLYCRVKIHHGVAEI